MSLFSFLPFGKIKKAVTCIKNNNVQGLQKLFEDGLNPHSKDNDGNELEDIAWKANEEIDGILVHSLFPKASCARSIASESPLLITHRDNCAQWHRYSKYYSFLIENID